jgi:hypothetical protein
LLLRARASLVPRDLAAWPSHHRIIAFFSVSFDASPFSGVVLLFFLILLLR